MNFYDFKQKITIFTHPLVEIRMRLGFKLWNGVDIIKADLTAKFEVISTSRSKVMTLNIWNFRHFGQKKYNFRRPKSEMRMRRSSNLFGSVDTIVPDSAAKFEVIWISSSKVIGLNIWNFWPSGAKFGGQRANFQLKWFPVMANSILMSRDQLIWDLHFEDYNISKFEINRSSGSNFRPPLDMTHTWKKCKKCQKFSKSRLENIGFLLISPDVFELHLPNLARSKILVISMTYVKMASLWRHMTSQLDKNR